MAKNTKNEGYNKEFENTKTDYEKWLEEIGEEDSDLLREWYELDDKDRYEWLENHPDF